MNIVEFALKMRDMASQPLRQFGAAANQTFMRANTMTNNLSTHNRVLGQSYNELQARIRQVENTIRTSTIPSHIATARRELEKLQRQANNHQGKIGGGYSGAGTSGTSSGGGGLMGMMGGMKGMVAGAAIGAGVAAFTALGSGISDSINKGLERQQIQTSFNVLTGSESKGANLTKQLVELTPKMGDSVFKNAQTMMGFGFDSTEVQSNLKMLGDVSMGNKDKLQALTLAFSQTKAAGKLMGQDLLQYINAGFNPLQTISEKTGKSIGKLKEEMEKGLIPFSMIQQAFKDATSEGGRFNDMLAKIAETPAGKIQQLSGQWNEFKVQAGAAMIPLVSMALELAQKVMPIVENLITPLTNGVQNVVNWVKSLKDETGGVMGYFDIIKNILQYGIGFHLQNSFHFITNIVAKLGQFIANSVLLQDIFRFIGIIVTNIYQMIGMLIDGLSWVFDNIIMPILNAIENVYRFITGRSSLNVTQSLSPDAKKQAQSNNDLLADISKNTAQNTVSATNAEKAVTSGGPKVINITVQKFLDSINIHTTNLDASESEIESKILEMFGRVVVQGGYAQ